MERAVLDAYGWSDIAVPPYCPMNDEENSAVETFSDDIIDRLYVLNADRAAEEQRHGLDDGSAVKWAAPKKPKKKKDTTMSLPDMGDAKGVS